MDNCQTAGQQSPETLLEFPLFCRLPPEIRTLIWEQALPLESQDPPAIFAYRWGCWQPRYLMPSEPDYLPHWGMDHNIDFGFHHYLLDPVQLEVPLHFVNHESRRVALHWMHHHCIEIWSYDGRVLFSRWFDRDRDTLYIPESSRDQFLAEPLERPFEPDLLDKTISMTCNEFTRLALPITVLHTDPSMIEEIIRISRVDTIFLLIGQQPNWNDLPLVDGKVLRRFELEKTPRVKALIFLRKYGESVTSVLIDEKVKRFEMQPTYLTLQTGI